jgi:hypothetical protein
VQFRLADLLFRRAQLSATNIDALFELWTMSMAEFDDDAAAPFQSCQEMLKTIDSSKLGDIPWQCLVTGFSEEVDWDAPEWMRTSYEVWYRDPESVVSLMLDNPDFQDQFDLRPYIDLDANGNRRWSDVMSGNVAWRHCVSHHHANTILILSRTRNKIY